MYKNHVDLISVIGFRSGNLPNNQRHSGYESSLSTESSWKKDASGCDCRTEWHRFVRLGKLAESALKFG